MQTSILTKVFGDRDLETAIDVAGNLGYDAVELMGADPHFGLETTDERAREVRRYLEDRGTAVSCVASYTGGYVDQSLDEREETLADLERHLELADIVGCDRVRHGPGGPLEHEATDDDYETAATWLRRAADLAADHDKELLVEIHSGTIVESADAIRDLLERVDRDNVGAVHDAGNMYISDVEYGRESVEALGDRLRHVHVKDERRVADDSLPGAFEYETVRGTELFQPALLGHGEADHGPLFEALADRGYDGYVTTECHLPPHGKLTDASIAGHDLAAVARLWDRAQRA